MGPLSASCHLPSGQPGRPHEHVLGRSSLHPPYTSAEYLRQTKLLWWGGLDEPFAPAALGGPRCSLPSSGLPPPPPHSELEDFVEDLKKDSTSAGRVVTLKDVEDGAFLLRQVGEAVASLKGEPPPGREKSEASLRGMGCKNLPSSEGFVHSCTQRYS